MIEAQISERMRIALKSLKVFFIIISLPPLVAAQIVIDEFCHPAKFARELVKLPASGRYPSR